MIALAAASVCAMPALAEDKPSFGPVPAWVKPQPAPATPAQQDGAPMRVLLSDQQVQFERGRQTVYSASLIEIETPPGLAVGNISLPWRPDTDTLTVHTLLIHRGAEVIDVLKAGQTFTVVRREQNLEQAMLDGVLTANIQPEGLQVGDVLELAMSVSHADPVVKGHVEQLAAAWNPLPITRAHASIRWPSDMPVHLRSNGSLPRISTRKEGGYTVAEIGMADVAPAMLPKGAPPRFRIGRLLEASDFTSWADLAALFAPLFAQAAQLPADGALKTESDRIRALPDAKARAQAALTLVQDRIRYVALAMGAGGLVPADAPTTWARRYGDCKAKTALLLGLLHAAGIEAEPVLVGTGFGDGLDQRLPMIALFDHVLVRAHIGDRIFWLDGTRTGDTDLDRIRPPAFGWGLPVQPERAALVRMMPPPLTAPGVATTIRIDARNGLTVPAPFIVDTVMTGDEAIGLNASLSNLTGAAKDQALRGYWHSQYDFVEVKSAAASFDRARGEARLSMTGSAKLDWSSGWYETDGTGVGYKADLTRDAGPDRDAPWALPFPYYNRVQESIRLPAGFRSVFDSAAAAVDETVGGIEYHRHADVKDGIFTIEKTERSLAPEMTNAEAAAAQPRLRALAEKTVYLRRPDDYVMTDAELAIALKETPTTVVALIDRGNALLNRERHDEAIADYSKAAALAPHTYWPLADRGLAYARKGDVAAAERDFAAAEQIEPRNPFIANRRGWVAMQNNRPKEAVAAYTRAIELTPDDTAALYARAAAYRKLTDHDAALADVAKIKAIAPKDIQAYMLRANILRDMARTDDVLAEADAIAKAFPTDTYALAGAAAIRTAAGRPAEAMALYDRAIAIKPEAYLYVNRALARPVSDVVGRRADLDSALALDATGDAVKYKADLELKAGDPRAALAAVDKAAAAHPDDDDILVVRSLTRMRAGQQAAGESDWAILRAKATTPFQLNNLCWEAATTGVALARALEACDAALIKLPNDAAIRDSRALTLLRMGRIDEAIVDYDRVLAMEPRETSSLWGRSIAWSKKGDRAKSDADAAAAIKIDPRVETRYAAFGMTR